MTNLSFYNYYNEEKDDFSDIIFGLKDEKQKKLSSKYFYDENGSTLFDEITTLKEYYPTKKEIEILENQDKEFFKNLPSNSIVIEFGGGSNKKIIKLLKALNNPIEYIPIDISKEFLYKNAAKSAKKFPDIKVSAICADFDQVETIEKLIGKERSKIGFFPGSTIGNYCPKDAKKLLKKFSKILGNNNYLIVGVDLKKDVDVLEKAYNDSEGITAKFNKNILNGINNKCGSFFNVNNFYHKAFFNKNENRVEMHLVSKKRQSVQILDNIINIDKGESIHTENSYKYSLQSFKELSKSVGFEIIKVLTDEELFFGVFFLKVKNS